MVLRMLLMIEEISNLAVLTVYVPPTHGNDIICTPFIPHAEAIQSVIHPTQWQSFWKCRIGFPPRRPLDFCVLVETKAFQHVGRPLAFTAGLLNGSSQMHKAKPKM